VAALWAVEIAEFQERADDVRRLLVVLDALVATGAVER
jgi:hypothetical protein